MDAAFLTHGVHVNVEPYSPGDVKEIEAPVAGQCSKCVGKQPSHFETFAGKKRKGQPIEYIIDAIMEFTDMSRKRRSDKDNNSRKTTVESAQWVIGSQWTRPSQFLTVLKMLMITPCLRSLMNSKSPIVGLLSSC